LDLEVDIKEAQSSVKQFEFLSEVRQEKQSPSINSILKKKEEDEDYR